MVADNETVKRIAFLSRLKIEPEKIEDTKLEFNKILNWMGEMNEVNTDNVEPLSTLGNDNLLLRDDVIKEGQKSNLILKNAPEKKYNHFVVPKVVE